MQTRKKAPLLLPDGFAVFIRTAILHPFSHGEYHDEDNEHECPICLWLDSNTVFVPFGTSLLVFFTFLCFCRSLLFIPSACSHFTAQSSRAPPIYL